MTAPLRARNVSRATELGDRLEVADGLWAKFMGLMGRPGARPGAGLWLPGTNGIHMMFMRFADRRRVPRPARIRRATSARPVLSVHRGLRAWIGLVPLVRGADGVLELPVGTIERSGTAVGDRIALEPAAETGRVRGKSAVKRRRPSSARWPRSDGSSSGALDLAFPATCSGCGREGPPLCATCLPALDARLGLPGGTPIGLPADIPAPLLQLEWCAPFAGPVRTRLHELKYAGERRLAEPLGAAVARRWARVGVGRRARRAGPGPRRPRAAARLRPGGAHRRGGRARARPAARPGARAPPRDDRPVRARPRRAGDERRRRVRASGGRGLGGRPSPGAGSCSSTTSSRPARRWRPAAMALRRGRRRGRLAPSPSPASAEPDRTGTTRYTRWQDGPRPDRRASHRSDPAQAATAQGVRVRTIVKGKNVEVPDRVREYAERKLRRIERLLDDRTDAIVELWNEQHRSAADSHIAEVTPRHRRPGRCAAGRPARATRRRSTTSSTRSSARRSTTRRSRACAPGPRRRSRSSAGSPTAPTGPRREPRIVKIKRFAIEPMFEEDAVAAMEELGHQFFVFVNAETERVADPLPPPRRRLRPDRAGHRRRLHEGHAAARRRPPGPTGSR